MPKRGPAHVGEITAFLRLRCQVKDHPGMPRGNMGSVEGKENADAKCNQHAVPTLEVRRTLSKI